MYNNRQPLKTYDIHPMSIKLIRSGHPWVTNDKFSEKFHPKEKFIVAANRSRPFALLLHDPTHKHVRARVWATSGHFQKLMKNFKNDLISRIRKSVKMRFDKKFMENRNHCYMVFGENDELPGLFVRYIGGEVLIEFYMEFWKQYQDFIIQNTLKAINEVYAKELTVSNVWIQYRSQVVKEPAICMDPMATYRIVNVNEYGVNYKVILGKHYDTGIYTDMAAIRSRLKKNLANTKSLLNLYSYTGAFSLYAMSLGIEEVTSVDLSEQYLEWLEENIKLNKDFNCEGHKSMPMSTHEALEELKHDDKKFDFIISDPPSSSSDGNRRTNALQEYQNNLPEMCDLLYIDGQILAFLNTHKVSMDKFKNKIKTIIHKKRLPLVLNGNLYLSEDCPYKKGFPEGAYLKGILLKKVEKKEKPQDKSKDKPKKEKVEVSVEEESIGNKAQVKAEVDDNIGNKIDAGEKKIAKKVNKKAGKKTTKKTAKKTTKKVAKKATKKKTTKKVASKVTKKKTTKKTPQEND